MKNSSALPVMKELQVKANKSSEVGNCIYPALSWEKHPESERRENFNPKDFLCYMAGTF